MDRIDKSCCCHPVICYPDYCVDYHCDYAVLTISAVSVLSLDACA